MVKFVVANNLVSLTTLITEIKSVLPTQKFQYHKHQRSLTFPVV